MAVLRHRPGRGRQATILCWPSFPVFDRAVPGLFQGPQLSQNGRNELRDRGVDNQGAPENGVARSGTHHVQSTMDRFLTAGPENCCTQDFLCVGAGIVGKNVRQQFDERRTAVNAVGLSTRTRLLSNATEQVRMASQVIDCKTRIYVFWHAARSAVQLPSGCFVCELKIPAALSKGSRIWIRRDANG